MDYDSERVDLMTTPQQPKDYFGPGLRALIAHLTKTKTVALLPRTPV